MIGILMPLIVVIVLVGVVALVNLLRKQTIKPENLPYRKKDYLLTPAERSFYEVLQRVTGDSMQVFVKVRLADLVWLPKGTQNRQVHLNRVISKHADFVLCNRETVSPVLVIELDDSSHNMSHRRSRDAVVNDILHSVGLPLLRIPAKRSYAPNELSELIRNEINKAHTGISKEAHGW
jgi:very-short-patch-repair endonuclease